MRRLEFYKRLEAKLNSFIEAEDIVKQLQFLVILAAGYHIELPAQVGSRLCECFDDEQRKILYSILNDVVGKLHLRRGRGIFTEDTWLV